MPGFQDDMVLWEKYMHTTRYCHSDTVKRQVRAEVYVTQVIKSNLTQFALLLFEIQMFEHDDIVQIIKLQWWGVINSFYFWFAKRFVIPKPMKLKTSQNKHVSETGRASLPAVDTRFRKRSLRLNTKTMSLDAMPTVIARKIHNRIYE